MWHVVNVIGGQPKRNYGWNASDEFLNDVVKSFKNGQGEVFIDTPNLYVRTYKSDGDQHDPHLQIFFREDDGS